MGAISYNATDFYDRDFGPYMVPVTPPGVAISPSSTLKEPSLGRAPGRLTQSGWAGINLHDPRARCLDRKTARLWDEGWGANVGFVAGDDGYVILDNDQGTEFTEVLIERFVKLGVDPLRRYVLDPKHHRDAFIVRVLDFVGDPVKLASRDFQFRNGNRVGKFQILAAGKQAVISGTHRETKAPYVWDRTITSIQDVPNLSEDQFEMFLGMFVAKLQERGWSSGHPVSPSLVSQKPAWQLPHTTSQLPHHKLSSGEVDALIQGAVELLAQIPNRDVPAGETPNAIDRWLDEYGTWRDIAYALAAYLGDAAQTPEAEDLFTNWSDGRAQVKQTSKSLWKSVIRQPIRFEIVTLPNMVRSVTPRTIDFPPFDPSDPILATPTWDRLRDEWVFLTSKGCFVHLDSAMIVSRQAFSDLFAHLAPTLADELSFKRKKGSKLSVADMFVSQPSMQAIEALTYAPGDDRLIPGKSLPVFNKWRPTAAKPLQVFDKDVQPWLDHVEYVLGSRPERDRFVKWSAFVAQLPEEKPNWHFLILSHQGVGKDTMVEPLKRAVGVDNWKEDMIDNLAGNFNDGAETKLMVISEASQPKWDARKAETVLKQVLSKPPDEIWINQKNIPRYKIPNRLAAIMFSNEAIPVSLDPDQRRLHVLNCRSVQPKAPSYYQALWDWLNKGGTEITAGYLLSYSLSDADRQEFIGGTAPNSVAKSMLEQQSANPYQDALEEIIRDSKDGIGAFTALVADIGQLAEHIGYRTPRRPSSQVVRGLLLDMENRGTGVRRLKVDPKSPTHCGVITDNTRKISGRLWALADKTATGQDWQTLLDPEIIALWRPPSQNKPVQAQPASSSTPKQPPDFPVEDDEII